MGDAERFSVIHSGMELSRFIQAGAMTEAERHTIRQELGIPQKAVLFTMVGRMEPRKGHRFFVTAAAELAARKRSVEGPSPVFAVVGDGPEQTGLKAQAESLGVADRFFFVGYRHDVERMFAMTDVAVLTSLWEGLPRVLVQAAATGRPAISFACDGAGEVIGDGENGWVVRMRDTVAVADAMERLLIDAPLRKTMGAAARQRVNESWTVESMVAAQDELYARLLGEA